MPAAVTMKRLYRVILMIAAWAGILAVIGPGMTDPPSGTTGLQAMLGSLSFFTVQTNIFVAIWVTAAVFLRRDDHPLLRPHIRGGLTVYITVTFLVYAIVLAPLWEPEGIALFATIVTHYVTPLAFILDWLLFEPRRAYRWRYLLDWLAYPIVYLIFSQIEGPTTGDYLYPFLDRGDLGWGGLALNVVGLLVLFVILGGIYTGINKLLRPQAAA
jgi:hypothetical protein